jgi:hypothetical protein
MLQRARDLTAAAREPVPMRTLAAQIEVLEQTASALKQPRRAAGGAPAGGSAFAPSSATDLRTPGAGGGRRSLDDAQWELAVLSRVRTALHERKRYSPRGDEDDALAKIARYMADVGGACASTASAASFNRTHQRGSRLALELEPDSSDRHSAAAASPAVRDGGARGAFASAPLRKGPALAARFEAVAFDADEVPTGGRRRGEVFESHESIADLLADLGPALPHGTDARALLAARDAACAANAGAGSHGATVGAADGGEQPFGSYGPSGIDRLVQRVAMGPSPTHAANPSAFDLNAIRRKPSLDSPHRLARRPPEGAPPTAGTGLADAAAAAIEQPAYLQACSPAPATRSLASAQPSSALHAHGARAPRSLGGDTVTVGVGPSAAGSGGGTPTGVSPLVLGGLVAALEAARAAAADDEGGAQPAAALTPRALAAVSAAREAGLAPPAASPPAPTSACRLGAGSASASARRPASGVGAKPLSRSLFAPRDADADGDADAGADGGAEGVEPDADGGDEREAWSAGRGLRWTPRSVGSAARPAHNSNDLLLGLCAQAQRDARTHAPHARSHARTLAGSRPCVNTRWTCWTSHITPSCVNTRSLALALSRSRSLALSLSRFLALALSLSSCRAQVSDPPDRPDPALLPYHALRIAARRQRRDPVHAHLVRGLARGQPPPPRLCAGGAGGAGFRNRRRQRRGAMAAPAALASRHARAGGRRRLARADRARDAVRVGFARRAAAAGLAARARDDAARRAARGRRGRRLGAARGRAAAGGGRRARSAHADRGAA